MTSQRTARPDILRDDLLADVTIAVSGAPSPGDGFAGAVTQVCVSAGARVIQWPLDPALGHSPPGSEAVDVLVNDAAGIYAEALRREAGSGLGALRGCLDRTWHATRTLTGAAASAGTGGRVIMLAPAPDAGPHADAARAALENLARTLSIEWARRAITTVTVAPGCQTEPADVGTLVAFLASEAGAYFSGCQLDLRGPPPAAAGGSG